MEAIARANARGVCTGKRTYGSYEVVGFGHGFDRFFYKTNLEGDL